MIHRKNKKEVYPPHQIPIKKTNMFPSDYLKQSNKLKQKERENQNLQAKRYHLVTKYQKRKNKSKDKG